MTEYVLKRSSEILCVDWGNLDALLPKTGKSGWTVDQNTTPPSRGGADYIKVGDRIRIEKKGDRYDLILSRKGIPDRVHEGVQLGGVSGYGNLWAKVSKDGLDLYLYLLKTAGPDREVHVEVFYIDTRHADERPENPGQVEIVG
jgi:hypothetical protein